MLPRQNLQNEIRQLDAGEVQKNMLTPGSQMVRELEKMKVLRKSHLFSTYCGAHTWLAMEMYTMFMSTTHIPF